MYDRRNAYLDRRMRERDMRMRGRDGRSRAGNGYLNDAEVQYQMGMRDGRNPYGSKGGYVRDHGGNDYAMDYRNDYAKHNSGYDYRGNSDYRYEDYARSGQYDREYHRPMGYEMNGYAMINPDYARGNRGRDYNYDYGRDYERDYADMEKEYHEELKKWIEKLKKEDRIRVSKDQILRQAKNMNIEFDDFTEEEFYATYLMVISDFPNVTNDYNVYVGMAKNWLMDKDAKLQGSDKLCTYMYEIVLGKSKEDDD
jgi:hypothetical protein